MRTEVEPKLAPFRCVSFEDLLLALKRDLRFLENGAVGNPGSDRGSRSEVRPWSLRGRTRNDIALSGSWPSPFAAVDVDRGIVANTGYWRDTPLDRSRTTAWMRLQLIVSP